ncbi:putative cfem domain-containing protein [Diaporthe ampelina]|uniref:Putative cfem domain-containing protein n=1 Tax=Diaporthe ampelina TaxID=1214573 RepID=A0A0G2IFB4_9PEZI|nr:putative cfem domain-containing protein [Diaporthe ampelina]
MLFPTVSLSAAIFAGLTVAQFNGLPTCAQGCASQFFSGGSYAGCGTDPKCICANEDFIGNVACCLVGACSEADQQSALTFAQQICSANGVDVPDQVSCSTASGASATATGTPSGSSSSGSATATATGDSASATGDSASATSSGTTAAAAWAPRQTAALGLELLGGLAAAGLALL